MNLFWARVSTPSLFFSPVPYSNAIEWFRGKVTVPEIVLISAKHERSAVLHIVGQEPLLIPLVHIHPCSTLYLLLAAVEIYSAQKQNLCANFTALTSLTFTQNQLIQLPVKVVLCWLSILLTMKDK